MKTICRLADYTQGPNISLYLFPDDKQVLIESDRTTIGDPSNPEMYIMDCDSSNVVLHEGVTEPDDWFGWKYFYTADGGWTSNPAWIDPRLPLPTDSGSSDSETPE
jgi:Tol biopolymer transport system component